MKWYIASRVARKDDVDAFAKTLIDLGETVVSTWTSLGKVKPYTDNLEQSNKLANQMIDQVQDADIFVLLSDSAGTGMYVELGAAIASNCRVFIIGEFSDRTLFSFHTKVTRCDSFDDVLEILGLTKKP